MSKYFAHPPTTAARNDFDGAIGAGFIPVGALIVTRLGRYYGGSTHDHVVKIWQHGVTGTPVASGTILAASAADSDGYKWVTLGAPVTLAAGTRYYIVVDETNGQDVWKDNYDHTGLLSNDVTHWGLAYETTRGAYPTNQSAGVTGYNTGTFEYTVDTKTYYVSAAGSNSNNGLTTGAPFLTLGHAQSVAGHRDTILLRRGDTFVESVGFTKATTIDAYGTGAAPIIAPSGSTQNAIKFTNCHDGIVQNIKIVGANTGTPNVGSGVFAPSWPAGVEFANTETGGIYYSGPKVLYCDISGFQTGVAFTATDTEYSGEFASSSGFEDFEVAYNTIHHCYDCGVKSSNGTQVRSSNFVDPHIHDNVIHDITGNSSFNSGFGIFLLQALGSNQGEANATGVIEGNVVYSIGKGANHNDSGGPACILTCHCQRITIQNNEAYDCVANSQGVDGIGIDLDISSKDCVMQYNYVHDNDYCGLYLFVDDVGSIVRFNLSVGNNRTNTTYGELAVNSNCNAQIYHNTLISNHGRGLTITGDRSNGVMTVFNNVIVVPEGVVALELNNSGNLAVYRNLYWDGTGQTTFRYDGANYVGLKDFTGASSQEDFTGMESDPLLVSRSAIAPTFNDAYAVQADTRFRPTIGSPLRNNAAGVQEGFSVEGPYDIRGVALGSERYNIGAYNTFAEVGPVTYGGGHVPLRGRPL